MQNYFEKEVKTYCIIYSTQDNVILATGQTQGSM